MYIANIMTRLTSEPLNKPTLDIIHKGHMDPMYVFFRNCWILLFFKGYKRLWNRFWLTALSKSGFHNGQIRMTWICNLAYNRSLSRIGSLQSLLKTSRSLTTSKQKLFADLPSFKVPDLDKKYVHIIHNSFIPFKALIF